MTTDAANVAELIHLYRRASANLRRQNASTFDMAVNVRTLDAYDANNHVRGWVRHRLIDLGQRDVADALDAVHDLLPKIASAQDEGRTQRLASLRKEIKVHRRVIREAIAS